MKTANELKHLAAMYGWEIKPLTYAQVQRMTADEYEYQRLFNEKEMEKALASTQPGSATWSEEQKEKLLKEYPEFIERLLKDYPQLIDTPANAGAVSEYVIAKAAKTPYAKFTFADLREAFEKQGAAGRLILNPSACGAGPETEVTGQRLIRHPNLWKLLEPRKAANPEATMSAAEYKKAHPELQDAGLPPMIRKRFDQANATFLSFHPEYVRTSENAQAVIGYLEERGLMPTLENLERAYSHAYKSGDLEVNEGSVVAGQVQKMVDFRAARTKGVPARSDRTSFQASINSMTSAELKEKIAIDPEFRAALDGLGQ